MGLYVFKAEEIELHITFFFGTMLAECLAYTH
jgi:hypothetical protein